jgi:hypothetical protein
MGKGMYQQYEDPILQEYMKILGLGPGGGGAGYTNPAMSKMMQAPLQEGQQAAGAASRNLKNMGLGPVATQTGQQQIDLSRMSNAQSAAFKNIQTMITQALTAGGQGTGMMGTGMGALGTAGGQLGQAAGQFGSAASGFGQIAELEAKAAAANNFSLASGLKAIAGIAGTIGGFFIGGPAGAAMGGAGASALFGSMGNQNASYDYGS